MTKTDAKKQLLLVLAQIITKDDDLFPDDLDLDAESPAYKRWDKARNELAEEFERRAKKAGAA